MSETQPLVGDKGTTYSAAPPPYAPPPQQAPYPAAPTTTVITQPPVIVQQHNMVVFGPTPVTVICPNGHEVTTNVSYKSGSFTFIVAALICFFLGPCCALIPFCVDGMKDVEHTCPVDGTVLGVFKRSL